MPADTPDRPVDPRIARTRNDVLSTALAVLIEEGWEAVTHNRLAAVAGYSRTTLYKHWPTRGDLLRDAFGRIRQQHHAPTGDLRADLVGELTALRAAIVERHVDRLLAVLHDLSATTPDLGDVRERFVAEGEQTVRGLLAPVTDGPELEAAVVMLGGAILYAAMMYGTPPADDVIASTVDLALAGLARTA